MKKIVISGYYGFDNAGDEALLSAIATTLREMAPDISITVLSASPQKTKALHGVNAVSRTNPLVLIKTLRQADLLISGGGSLLQDVTSARSIVYYLGVVALALLLGTRVMFYAQGIGPITTWVGKTLTRIIGNRVDLITLRDEQSKEELTRLGVVRPPIYVTADPVLGLRPAQLPDFGQRILSEHGVISRSVADQSVNQPLAGIALRNWKGLAGFKVAAAKAADYLAGKGWEIVLIPLHYPEDVAAARDVQRLMQSEAHLLAVNLTAQQAMAVIGEMDLLIGMRLHSLIFAAVMGVPVVGITYDPKVTQFLHSIGQMPAGNVDNLTADALIAAVEKVISHLDETREMITKLAGPMCEQARNSARLALKLLENKKP
ncbi:MAG: polysaccharide pyruvyl transferase CsaB [Firmicutes bacterium]|nr:polysaccharide pyruvyl transferase CsaB [Bacillota bacterium]